MTRAIAIAGCGPAGLAAALLLQRDGHRVVVFERFAAPRPVGSGLLIQPTGMAVLRSLGLDAAVLAAGARIERLFGRVQPSGRVVLDVSYRALRGPVCAGTGVHRATLFGVLHQAAVTAGIPVETGRTITGTTAGPRRALLFADGSQSSPFDLVVDALGSSTRLAPQVGRVLEYGAFWASLDWRDGFDPHVLEQRYVRASTMAGVLPLGIAPGRAVAQAALFWSLRVDRLEAWRQAGLEAWKDQVRGLWPATAPLLDQIGCPDDLTFARYSHRALAAPAEPGLIHIGDAWHSASPQLGQGANMALLDAYALAKALREVTELPAALARAVALRRRHVWAYQQMSAMFTPAYQSDGRMLPFIRDRVVGPLGRIWPATWIQAAMVSGHVLLPLRGLGLD